MADMNEQAGKKIKDLVGDIKTCMFTTTNEECSVYSRPMFTVKVDNECQLWYFTKGFSEKVKDIAMGKSVTLVFSHPGKNSYMNIYGNCELVHDKNKMKELWQPAFKAWFPEGTDDPGICLLKVVINEAFYWDNSSNDMICLYKNESHKPYQTTLKEHIFIPQTSHW